MLTFEDARGRVLAGVNPVAGERVAATEAVGRVLADAVTAPRELPRFDYSAMDGYAVCTGDYTPEHTRDGVTELTVVGESRTGGDLPGPVLPGTACRIFTGARIPRRADAVVMQEHVERVGPTARFARVPHAGANIRRAGEDVAAHALVLEHGTRLTPFHVGLLTGIECPTVTVARRPVVAIVSTGDELRDAGTPDRPGSVVDANGPTLGALVTACGGIPRRMPFVRDDLASTRDALREALHGTDLVVTVGGVSVGDHDEVRRAMDEVGIGLDFWKVAIKPGKPLVLGRASSGQTVLGLPGNPASATLTFVLFAAPLVRALQGDRQVLPPRVPAVLAEPVRHAAGRTEFIRAWLDETVNPATVRALPNQASGAVTSFAWANALAVIPLEAGDLPAGHAVSCIRLRDV